MVVVVVDLGQARTRGIDLMLYLFLLEAQIVSALWLCKCFLCNDSIFLWFLLDFKTFS